MDINDMHIGVTLLSLAVFVAIFAHCWSRRRAAEYEQAQRLPFLDDDTPEPGAEHE